MKQLTLEDTKQKLKDGVDKLANIVKITMGACGKNVIIRDAQTGQVFMSNDGYNISKAVELEDVVENTGAMLAKLAAHKTNEEAKDGTTATIVMLQAYLNAMMDIKTKDQRGLREEIRLKIEHILSKIEIKKTVGQDDLYNIAKTSSLDDEIAEAVVALVGKIGSDGIFIIEESSTPGITTEVIDGITVEDGYATPWFINNTNTGNAEFKDVPVLIVDKHINSVLEIAQLMDTMVKSGQSSMVLFVKQISDEVLSVLANNKQKGVFKSCVIKTNEFEDVELITGAKIISDSNGVPFDKSSLGYASNVVVSDKNTIVSANKGKDIKTKIEELKSQLEESKDKEKLQEKISKLENGIATIRIGGDNVQETKEKKDKLEDAMGSVMSAMKAGYVEGGGMTLYRISRQIKENDQASKLIKEVLQTPLKQIIKNGENDFNEVIKGYDTYEGYNVLTRRWEDLFANGVIDSVQAVKSALNNSVSMGNQILTVEAGIIEENPKQ